VDHGPKPLPEPPRKPPRKMLRAVIIIAILVVVIVALVLDANAVHVTTIEITSSDGACGVAGDSEAGFVAALGAMIGETLWIDNAGNSLPCNIITVNSTTAGFSVSGADTPFSVPAGTSGYGLSFTITAPYHDYSGVLTIDIE
jgi:hypothetical protein